MERAKERNKPKLNVPDFWTSQSHSTIRTQHGIVPFVPFPWQLKWIGEGGRTDFDNLTYDNVREFYPGVTSREMLLKARDVGSSEICVRWPSWLMMRFGGNMLIKADKEDNAKNLIKIARQYLTSLPERERPSLIKDNEKELELAGIGTIKAICRGGGRSERCMYRLDTERAFWENAAEEEAAVSGALVAGGHQIIESTANGFGDYHQKWTDVQNGYRKTFIGRDDNPTHDAEWWQRKQSELAKQGKTVQQEYPATSAEAFIATGNSVFDAAIARGNLEAAKPPILTDLNGAISIWVKPVIGRQYIAGADVAEGIDSGNDHLDYSHMCIYDWRTLKHVASLHGQWPTDVFARLCYDFGKLYGFPFCGVERNNHGLAVINKLVELGYPAMYNHEDPEDESRDTKAKPSRVGWMTTPKSKPIMEDDFGSSIKAEELYSPDARLWDQVLSYVYHGDGKSGAQSGCHDDVVLAHMIALQMHSRVARQTGGIVVGQMRMG